MKYKLTLQYDGTRYAGWQIQRDRPTVQGLLREAVTTIAGEEVSVVGAGRTDSGVHAVQQVAHLVLSQPMLPLRLLQSLNGILPWDVRVLRVNRVSADFHAQRDARRKRYEYRIWNGPVLPPFLHGRILHLRSALNALSMRSAADSLCGAHDFSGFAASTTRVKSKTRTVFLSEVVKRGRTLLYRVEADGFLHHMVRNIVGTLIQIGRGKRPPNDMERILRSRDRRLAGPTAPAEGLFLMRVWYR